MPTDLVRVLADAAPVALMVVDRRGWITYANAAAHELSGWPAEKLLGCDIAVVLPAGLDRGTGRACGGPPLLLRQPDGSSVPIEVRQSEVEFDGQLVHILALTDASDLIRLSTTFERRTRELRRSNDELREFAHFASHDLRQPLRTIGSFTELLAKHLGDRLDPTAQGYADFIRSGVARMQQLISDLLTYAQIGEQARPMRPVDVTLILNNVVASLGAAIHEAGADLRLGEMPEIVGDEVQLSQLLQNLIDNAIKFRAADRRPVVAVSAERHSQGWLFRVSDNGIGIPPAHAERIFQMFRRLHSQDRFEGSGIGLTLAKKIAERHGGRLWLESVEGAGTTFHFTIPDPDHRLVSDPLEPDGRPASTGTSVPLASAPGVKQVTAAARRSHGEPA